jgi:hypothetical protein
VKSGKIYDFFINPDTLERVEATLTGGEHIDVPAGWAQEFYTFEPSELIHLLGGVFDATLDRTIYWDDPAQPLSRNFPLDSLIMSKKDSEAKYSITYDFLVLGARGFLGSHCVRSLRAQGFKVFESNARLGSPLIREQIVKSSARFVVCAAGIAGKPTIDLNVQTTIFGSGLIYSGAKTVYTEDDIGDNNKKVYSKWRIELEKDIPKYTFSTR